MEQGQGGSLLDRRLEAEIEKKKGENQSPKSGIRERNPLGPNTRYLVRRAQKLPEFLLNHEPA